MGKERWLQLPGVANIKYDAQGHVQIQDLIPGKQLGTNLDEKLFNPVLIYLCDLRDDIDGVNSVAVSGQGYGGADKNVTRLWMGGDGKQPVVRDQDNNITFLATNAALSDEISRAMSVEAGLLSLDGTRWMTGGLVVAAGDFADDTQADGFSARFSTGNISARFTVGLDHLNYPYASVAFFDQNNGFHQWMFGANNRIVTPAGNTLLETILSEDDHLWARNFGREDSLIAWLSDVQAETARAMTVEADCVKTAPDDADWQLNKIGVNKSTGKAWGYNSADNRFFYFVSPDDLLAAVSNLVSGQGYGGTDKSVRALYLGGGTGKQPLVRDQDNNTTFLATDEKLDAEISRAMSVEADCVKTSPDDADWQLNKIGVNKATGKAWGFNSADGKFFYFASPDDLLAAVSNLVSGQGYGGTDKSVRALYLGGGTGKQPLVRDQDNNTTFLATDEKLSVEISRAQQVEATLQPRGNYVTAADNNTKTVSFITKSKHGQRIDFPTTFGDDDVVVTGTVIDGLNNHVHLLNYFNIDKSGFSPSITVWNGSGLVTEDNLVEVRITATGKN